MRGRFAASLLFAAAAALAWLPWRLAAGPVLGPGLGLGLFACLGAAAYVFSIAPRPSKGLQAALFTAPAAAAAWALAPGTSARWLAVAVVVAAVRSAFLYRWPAARALVVEAALLAGGFAVARVLTGPGPLAGVLALWGFLLVQSLFFLVADVAPRRNGAKPGDPFENARDRAMRLLDQTGV